MREQQRFALARLGHNKEIVSLDLNPNKLLPAKSLIDFRVFFAGLVPILIPFVHAQLQMSLCGQPTCGIETCTKVSTILPYLSWLARHKILHSAFVRIHIRRKNKMCKIDKKKSRSFFFFIIEIRRKEKKKKKSRGTI
jgi:hypothetical protein